jgi:hypothetical protein
VELVRREKGSIGEAVRWRRFGEGEFDREIQLERERGLMLE